MDKYSGLKYYEKRFYFRSAPWGLRSISEKFLFSLWAEDGALVLCPGGILSSRSFKVIYAVLERTQTSKNIGVVFLTPELPPWVVCGGDWINGIPWVERKPAKSLLRLGAWGLCSSSDFDHLWRMEGNCPFHHVFMGCSSGYVPVGSQFCHL